MKKSEIQSYVDQYNEKKGFVRWTIRDEPNIKALKKFINTLEDDKDLNSAQFLNLAKILLKKRTRIKLDQRQRGQESAETFNALATATFGGFSVLTELENFRQLTECNLLLCITHKSHGQALAKLLVGLSERLSVSALQLVQNIANQITNTEILLNFLSVALEEISTKESLSSDIFESYCSLVLLILPLQLEINWSKIFETNSSALADIHQLLNLLLNTNPEYLSVGIVEKILKLNSGLHLLKILNVSKYDEEMLNCFLDNNELLEHCYFINEIILIFHLNHWNINPYLQKCLQHGTNSITLKLGLEVLLKLKFNYKLLYSILDWLFDTPQFVFEITFLIETFEEVKFLNESLQELKNFGEDLGNLCRLIRLLKSVKPIPLHSVENLKGILLNREHLKKFVEECYQLKVHNKLNQSTFQATFDIIAHKAVDYLDLANIPRLENREVFGKEVNYSKPLALIPGKNLYFWSTVSNRKESPNKEGVGIHFSGEEETGKCKREYVGSFPP